jgi:general secretion pathway protein E/type IV pilus assembly protein PilB
VPSAFNNSTLELLISSDKKEIEFVYQELELLLNKNIRLIPSDPSNIQKLLSQYYRRNNQPQLTHSEKIFNLKSNEFLKTLIEEARSVGSSDIHVEAYEEKCRVSTMDRWKSDRKNDNQEG